MQDLTQAQSALCYIAGWAVDADSDQLVKGERTIKLEPKIMGVLLCLIEHQGQIISKEYLMQTVWPEVTITDHPINRAICRLRKIFQDEARTPRVIETIPKKGYRLICPVNSFMLPAAEPYLPVEAAPASEACQHPPNRWRHWLIPALTTLSLLLAGVFFMDRPVNKSVTLFAAGSPVPLTTTVGIERRVSFSPDNQKILYSHQNPDTRDWDVYLKEIDGVARRLTNSPLDERNACFTPDGSAITYIEASDKGSRILKLSLTDSSLSELAVEADMVIYGLQWAPNGKSLVYAARTANDYPYALFLYSPETGKKKQLTSPKANYYADRSAVFTPDGKHIIFARMDSQYNDDLFMMSTDDWQVKRLTYNNQITFGLDWSPMTNEVIYCVYDDGVYLLKSVNLRGETRLLELSTVAPRGTFPRISPSGKLLTLEQLIVRKNIYKATVNLNKGRLENSEIVVSSSLAEWNAKLSPDGRKIAYLSDRTGSNQLWIADADGSNATIVVDWNVPYNCMISWAPDGRSFVFSVKPGEIYLTYRYTVASGTIELLASDAVVPVHSRDGQSVYFSSFRSGDWRIWKIPAAGGKATQITYSNAFAPMESVDGQFLFYCKRGTPGIWKKTGQAKEVLVVPDLEVFETQNWLVVEDGIYYLKRLKNHLAKLMFYRFSDKTAIELKHPMFNKCRLDDGLSLSPDGRQIYFSLGDQAECDIKLIELARR